LGKKFFSILFILSVFIIGSAEKTKVSELPFRYKKWLQEEAFYIITTREREVFLELQTDKERDLFIEAFWKHRDPTPGTDENEFKKEHYRRINYANHFYGRVTPKPGWRTDRGRIYIILGEPNDIQRLSGKGQIYPSEVWFYQDKADQGLPPGFHVVFFQEGGAGEYRLYSPFRDGPQKLMPIYGGDPRDYYAAYLELKEIEPNLAEVSLSLIPGESSSLMGRPSMASDMLIQKIETVPQKQIEDRYAQKFLQYKDIVEVEYTANYIYSDSLVRIVRDPSEIDFVHYAVELPRLSVGSFENKYYTNLKLNGTVSNLEGKIIYQYEKNIKLEFDKEQIISLSHKPFNLHDMFPLIPGNYKFSVLIKNEVSKEFTSLERDLIIPQDDSSLHMNFLLLGYQATRSETLEKKTQPFRLGSYQIFCQPNNAFLSKDNLVIAFQIHGLRRESRQGGEIKFIFFKGGKEFRSFTKKISEYSEFPTFVQEFVLQDFLPDHYKIQVSLIANEKEVLSKSDEFDVTHLNTVLRPWIYSRILPDTEDPIYSYIIGTQLFKTGNIEKARLNLEKAFQKNADSVEYALDLAQTYIALAEYGKIKSILLPFLGQATPRYEVFTMLGIAYQNLGEFNEAIKIYDQAISRFGLNINLLNSLGECYYKLGMPEEALSSWEKSLKIDSSQPRIRKNIEVIKKKKREGLPLPCSSISASFFS
jgi:GWxTD domain-containing protein